MGWGPVDWVGRVLPKAKFEKNAPCFLFFFICSTDTKISVKNGVLGPVEWVGDQLTGWGGTSQRQNSEKNAPCFFNFLDFSDRYRDICKKKKVSGDQLNGFGTS